jgi:ketosteroid isomerase-like protein
VALSEAEVARVRSAFETMLAGDPEPWIALLAEDVRWDISAHPLPDVPDRGHGRAEAVQVWATYVSGWNAYRAEIAETTVAGDEIVALVHESVRMGETDVPLERDLVYAWSVSGGRVTLVRVFKTLDHARRAIGIQS